MRVLLVENTRPLPVDKMKMMEELGMEITKVSDDDTSSVLREFAPAPDLAIINLPQNISYGNIELIRKFISLVSYPLLFVTRDSSPDLHICYVQPVSGQLVEDQFDERGITNLIKISSLFGSIQKHFAVREESLSRLADSSDEMIYKMKIPEGTYEYVSKASAIITGYTPEDFYNSPKLIAEIIHPDWRHYFEIKWQNLLDGTIDPFYEYQIISKTGEVRWLYQRNLLIRNDDGRPASLEGVVSDVTESRNARNIIRRQSEEYRSIFDSTPAMIVVKDTSNRIVRANKLAAAHFGLKVEEMEGHYLDELFPVEADAYYKEDIEIILTGEPKMGIIEHFKHPARGYEWLKHDKYPYRNDKGEITGIMVVTQNITRQTETEMLLKKAEQTNTALIDSIPDLMFQYDRDGIHINFKAKDLSELFVPPEAFLGKSVIEVLPPPVGKKFKEFIDLAFEKGEMQVYEYSLPIADGFMDFEARFIQSGENEVLGIIRNISDKKRTERALQDSEKKYRNLIQNAPISLTRYLPAKRIYEFANAEMIRQAGLSLDELNALSDEEFNSMIHEDDRQKVLDDYEKWWNEGLSGIKNMTYRISNKKGEQLWLDSYHYADFDAEGKVQAINQIYIDISGRKKIEEALSKSEAQYKDLAKYAPVGVTRMSAANNKFEFVNDEFIRQYGCSLEELNELEKDEIDKFILSEDRTAVLSKYNDWLISGGAGILALDYRILNKHGNKLWLNTFIYSELTDKGDIDSINQICIDVTENKEAAFAISQSEEKFRAVSESLRAQIVIFQGERFVYANPYSAELTGYPIDELLNMNFWNLVHPDDKELAMNRGLARQRGLEIPIDYEMRIVTKTGEVKWLYYSAVMINYAGSPAVLGIAFDISDRKKYEEAIQKSEERYKTFIEQSSEGIYRLELPEPISLKQDYSFVSNWIIQNAYFAECNDAFAQMTGYIKPQDVSGRKMQEIFHEHSGDYFDVFSRFLNDGCRINNYEFIKKEPDGSLKYYVENAVGTVYEGALYRIWMTRKDITEQRQAEELLKKSLYEKDVLLREIHHRVKNNLQIVSSLLKLQSQFVKDPAVNGLLRESQNRVQSMSIIHQKLYQARDLSSIEFGEYVASLVSHLVQSFGMKPEDVDFVISANNIQMSLDNAIPAGLIINELVTNSLKHAFRDRHNKPMIEISLRHGTGNGEYVLNLKDNGRGFPEGFDLNTTSSFGLKLVTMLVEQMNGNLTFSTSTGAEFEVCFRASEYKLRS